MAIDNKQIAKRIFEELWTKGKLELVDELIDPSFQGHDPMLGTINRDALRESVKGYRGAFPDLKFEVNNVIAEGNFVVVRWTARGTNRGPLMGMQATGKNAVVTGLDYQEVRNGKIVSQHAEFDALGMLRQLGVDAGAMPQPSTRQGVETGKRT
jgi:steroid delta-isomerase-like uncharacterized protein